MSLNRKLKRLALFDFDGTLTKNDTFISFGAFCKGRFGLIVAIVVASPWLVGWKFGLIRNSVAKERLFKVLYRGMNYELYLQYGRDFSKEIDKSIRKEIMERLEWHKKQGHYIGIVSASLTEWIKPWAEKNGVDVVLATTAEVCQNKLTGCFATPNCYGAEKVRRVLDEFGNLNNMEIWGYGDSKGDDEILALANHKYKV